MRFRRFSPRSPARPARPAGLQLGFAVAAALAVAPGCAGKKDADGDGKSKTPDETHEDSQSAPELNPNLRALRVDDLRCSSEGKRADQKDLNHDGKADLVSLYSAEGTTLRCRQADFNFDGRLDAYFHYDDKGVLNREQFDLDYDGRIDIGRTFKDGKLVLDEQDTNRDGFVDAWRRYDKGRLLRIETDRDGDGRPDMFAYYVGGRVDRIGYDVNGDGRVDQWDHDAARRAREAEAIRKENMGTTDIPGGTTDEFVEETEGEEGAKASPKPATSAPERTGGESLKPKAGAGETPTVEAGETKSLSPDKTPKKGAAAKPPAKPAKPAKPAGKGAVQKPGVQKPGG